MSNDLVAFENQLKPLAPVFAEVLGQTMPVARMMRTVVVSCERNPRLLGCERQSLLNAAMTFAVLGLEVDGVTGQGFLVPFKDKRRGAEVVQPIIGYLGYNTIAARAKLTITGRVVREGDGFEFDEGRGYVEHVRKLGDESKRRIIAAWAKASSNDRPPAVRVLSIDELMAVKAKSPRGMEPPWADPAIGFPAMCEKTAKRRLRRDMPLSAYQLGATMEEAHEERGEHSWIHPEKGVMIEGEAIRPNHTSNTPTAQDLISPPSLQEEARMAAERGRDTFAAFCRRLTKPQYRSLRPYLESLQPIVEQAEESEK
jgi:recombination protein RecT